MKSRVCILLMFLCTLVFICQCQLEYFDMLVISDVTQAKVGDTIEMKVDRDYPGNFGNEEPRPVAFGANNVMSGLTFFYSGGYYLSPPPTVSIQDKYTAQVAVPKKVVSVKDFYARGRLHFFFDESKVNPLYILYPEVLELDKEEASVEEEVTVSSERPFFDEATFRKEKLELLCDMGYFIVWLSGEEAENGGVDKALATVVNPEKRPLPREYYVEVTPKSVKFRVPEWAKSGTVHVINEHGFVLEINCEGKSLVPNPPIVIDEEEKDGYFSTSVELKIK